MIFSKKYLYIITTSNPALANGAPWRIRRNSLSAFSFFLCLHLSFVRIFCPSFNVCSKIPKSTKNNKLLVVEFLSVCLFQAKNLIFPQNIETKSSFMTISLQFLSYHNPCSDKVCTLLINNFTGNK